MSKNIKVCFEMRSATIMERTLKKMGIESQIKNNKITIKRNYHDIVINGDTGTINCDEMDQNLLDDITQKYMVNWYKDAAVKEGNSIEEDVLADGRIEIRIK